MNLETILEPLLGLAYWIAYLVVLVYASYNFMAIMVALPEKAHEWLTAAGGLLYVLGALFTINYPLPIMIGPLDLDHVMSMVGLAMMLWPAVAKIVRH